MTTDDGGFDLRTFIESHVAEFAALRRLQPRWWEVGSRFAQARAIARLYGWRESRRLVRLLRKGPT